MHSCPAYDVVVIGGGPAGSATAITCARAGRRVLLAEAVPQPVFKVGETLPPSAYPLLRDLGLLDRVAAKTHLPCFGTAAAWGSDHLIDRDFIHDIHGAGWHLDRPRFDAGLRMAARECGAEIRLGCAFAGARRLGREAWELQLMNRGMIDVITASCVVDATGRRALFATAQGATSQRDDRLVAFCSTFPMTSNTKDARTFIEASEDGWWYSALLAEGKRLVAFFTDHDLPAAREVAKAVEFKRRLDATRHLQAGGRDHSETLLSRIRRFPAQSISRERFGGPGWIAVGDATLAFDPLSSQGMFHALYTGLRGAQTALAMLAGDVTALPAWHERLYAIRAAYRRHLAQSYGAEQRWPEAPFWQRRHIQHEREQSRPRPAGNLDVAVSEHQLLTNSAT